RLSHQDRPRRRCPRRISNRRRSRERHCGQVPLSSGLVIDRCQWRKRLSRSTGHRAPVDLRRQRRTQDRRDCRLRVPRALAKSRRRSRDPNASKCRGGHCRHHFKSTDLLMDTYNPDLAVGKFRVLPPRAKPNGAALGPTEPLPYIDMSSWDANSAPEREWAVDNRIPMYQPHLTTGHGAIGKSLLELTRAVAHVLGKPFTPLASINDQTGR